MPSNLFNNTLLNPLSISAYLSKNSTINGGLSFVNASTSIPYGFFLSGINLILSPSVIHGYCLSKPLNLSKSLYHMLAFVLIGHLFPNLLNIYPLDGFDAI